MENTFAKSFLHFLIFSITIVVGYVVGLMTLPAPDRVIAVTRSTVSIDQAKSFGGAEQQETELDNDRQFVSREINPLNGGKIIDIPKPRTDLIGTRKKQGFAGDPRITIVPRSNETNPIIGTVGDRVEIDISGQEDISATELSQLEQKNMIDDLSIMDQDDKRSDSKTADQTKFHDPFSPRTPLVNTPQEGYYEKTRWGNLPISSNNQIPLWQAYGNRTVIDPQKKPIAFILGGLGPDRELSIEALQTLPSEVTLGFVPYTNNLQELVSMARDYGHEVILEIPLESHDFPRTDAGVLALTIDDTPDIYQEKLNTLLSRVTGYSGVMNYLGSKYISTPEKSQSLLTDLSRRGLYFIENKTLRSGMLSSFASDNNISYGASYDIIDEVLSPMMISNALTSIEKSAYEGTPVIATGYVSRLTLSSLRGRIAAYKDMNIQLIPASAYIKNPH